jgi:hypothetical protein
MGAMAVAGNAIAPMGRSYRQAGETLRRPRGTAR